MMKKNSWTMLSTRTFLHQVAWGDDLCNRPGPNHELLLNEHSRASMEVLNNNSTLQQVPIYENANGLQNFG